VYAAYAEPDADFDKLPPSRRSTKPSSPPPTDLDTQLEIPRRLRLPAWDAKIDKLSAAKTPRRAVPAAARQTGHAGCSTKPTNHLTPNRSSGLNSFAAVSPDGGGRDTTATFSTTPASGSWSWIEAMASVGAITARARQKESGSRSKPSRRVARIRDESRARMGEAEREGATGQKQGEVGAASKNSRATSTETQ